LHIASESPARKRQRLSSPTYDDQVEDLTQDDLAAFDAIEAQLSQDGPSSSFLRPFSFAGQFDAKLPVTAKNTETEWEQSREPSSSYPSFSTASANIGLQDDPDNPFSHGFSSAAKLPTVGFAPATVAFASASKLVQEQFDFERSPSPEVPPEPDYDAWFKPAAIEVTPAFVVPVFSAASAITGFAKASAKGIIMPSKEALALAKAKMESWQHDENVNPELVADDNVAPTAGPATMLGFKSASESFESPRRTTFQTVSNILSSKTPATPSPAGFSRPSAGHTDAIPSPSAQYRPKQFRPPSKVGSPLNPSKPIPSSGFVSAATQQPHPLSAPPINAFSVASGSFNTPLSTKAHTSLPKKTPAPFRTPFKLGMRPADPGRLTLGQSSNPRAPLPVSTAPMPMTSVAKEKVAENWLMKERTPWNPKRKEFFSLGNYFMYFIGELYSNFPIVPPLDRKTLASSGLRPQEHSSAELEDLGM
jgi:breast cancer 2 susceptibility protein